VLLHSFSHAAEVAPPFRLAGLSTDELSAKTGMSESAVKVNVHRALKTMRDTIKKGGDDGFIQRQA
jgi:hypothetical protein